MATPRTRDDGERLDRVMLVGERPVLDEVESFLTDAVDGVTVLRKPSPADSPPGIDEDTTDVDAVVCAGAFDDAIADFLDDVRRADPTVPFLLVGSSLSDEEVRTALSAGVTDVVATDCEPAHLDLLWTRLERAVATVRRQRRWMSASGLADALTASMPDAALVVDDAGTILDANLAAAETFDRSVTELRDTRLRDLAGGDAMADHLAAVAEPGGGAQSGGAIESGGRAEPGGDRRRDVGTIGIGRGIEWEYVRIQPGEATDGARTLAYSFSRVGATAGGQYVGLVRDVTEKRDNEVELLERIRLGELATAFGRTIVDEGDRFDHLERAVEHVVDVLDVPYCVAYEHKLNDSFRVHATAGRDSRRDVVALEPDSLPTTVVDAGEPVVRGGRAVAAEARAVLGVDVRAGLAVPVGPSDAPWGVLVCYTDESDAFRPGAMTFVKTVGTFLGVVVQRETRWPWRRAAGSRITDDVFELDAAGRRRTLFADAVVELEIGLTEDDPFCRLAREADATVTFDTAFPREDDVTAIFFSTVGPSPDEVRSVLERDPSVRQVTHVDRTGEDQLFETLVVGDSLPLRIVELGGVPRQLVAEAAGTRVVVDLPGGGDVRAFLDGLAQDFPSVDLRSRRNREQPPETLTTFSSTLHDRLTERQRAALRTAYLAGYFEWPRENSSDEVAALLGVSQPTFTRHLRLAERTLLSLLYEDEREEEEQAST